MFPLVYALCLFCVIKSSVASLSDYYEGHDSLISQTYKHGDNGISDGVTSFLGKQPEIKAEGSSSLAYDNGIKSHGGSHSRITVPEQSGDLSLSSLDVSKHTSDQIKSLQRILQESEFLSAYKGHSDNYDALLGRASSGGLHDIYRVKPTDSEDLSLSSLSLAKHTSGVKSLYGSKFLSGYSANSKDHGSLSGYNADSNNHGSLSGYSSNSNNHGSLDSFSLGHASFGGSNDAKTLHHENQNYIKHVLHSSDSGTLHSAGDSHSLLPDHVSSSEYLRHSENTAHHEAHSDFRKLADALVHGWTALLNH